MRRGRVGKGEAEDAGGEGGAAGRRDGGLRERGTRRGGGEGGEDTGGGSRGGKGVEW